MGLLLRAVDVAGPLRWRWLLTEAGSGVPLADHQVDLESAPGEVARFADLYGYTRSYAVPDRRVDDGARFIAEAGAWAGTALLGEAVGKAIVAAAATGPVAVLVVAAAPVDPVLLWPLELAHAGGKPLAARGDVSFVYDIASDMTGSLPGGHAAFAAAGGGKAPVAGELRVLAVFSQPTRTSVLALRRERYELARLIRQLGLQRAKVTLRVAQYGVTRQRLREIAEDGDGWDVLHLSGHGAGGVFLLETADGSRDLVPTADLVGLLRPATKRLKLAVVSACESAADATAETYRLLGLTAQAEALEAESAAAAAVPVPGLARALVRDLGCPVIAMRYPVTDEFAIKFGDVLYRQLLSNRQPVDVAVARAVATAVAPGVSAAYPAVSVATPGIFAAGPGAAGTGGTSAAGLRLDVPRGRPAMDPGEQRMAYFPDEPPRFVGRAAPMAQASAALAPDSGRAGVLLHGMAGAGKTACALELAYRHQESFAAAAFWQAPTRGEEWASGLADFATRLDIQLADYGFTMAAHIGTEAALAAFAPRLRSLMATSGVLLVLDNLETLLTTDGAWRDPRWRLLIDALTTHDGESRVILTSRTTPASLTRPTASQARLTAPPAVPAMPSAWPLGGTVSHSPSPASPRVLTLPVHALSLAEAAALARELPNLRALLHADAGPIRETTSAVDADRDRILRVLRVVQGHPKLMELADAAAADRDRLDRQLAAAEQAAAAAMSAAPPGSAGSPVTDEPVTDQPSTDQPVTIEPVTGQPVTGEAVIHELDAFFRDGETTLDPAGFLTALNEWTRSALTVLSPEACLIAEFTACLEDGDRQSGIVGANWANLWRRLGRPGDPPEPGPLLAALTSAALVEAEPLPSADTGKQPGTGALPASGKDRPGPQALRMHPGVAAAITDAAGPRVREAVDAQLAAYWEAVFDRARQRGEVEVSRRVVRAGLAAVPYLLRRADWRTAGALLEQAARRDESPGVTQTLLPSLRRIAAATGAPVDAVRLAQVLGRVDPAEAERLLRGALDAASRTGDHQAASASAGQLFYLLLQAGRLEEALAVAERKPELTARAGLGALTQLGDQAPRLHVLGMMGDHARVLAEVGELEAVMAALPPRPGPDESVESWNVRESILSIGNVSALAMGEWARCLELNAAVVASMRERGAGMYAVTRFRFNDARPLIRLGRPAEAGRLLAECQRVFEDHADTAMLGRVLTARADLENDLGNQRSAVDLERAALRLNYARPEPQDIALSHHNLASYLGRLGGDRAAQRAHRLAAALIRRLAGMSHDLARTAYMLAYEMHKGGGPDPSLPSTLAQVIAVAEQTEGVHLSALLTALQPDEFAVEAALAEILSAATRGFLNEDALRQHLNGVILPETSASAPRNRVPARSPRRGARGRRE